MKNLIINTIIIIIIVFTNTPRVFEEISNYNTDYALGINELNRIKTYNHFYNLMQEQLHNTKLSNVEKQDFIDAIYEQIQINKNIISFYYCLAAAKTETEYNNKAVGRDGELSLLQFMEFTAKDICEKMNIKYYHGIELNISISVRMWFFHMNELLEYYDNNLELAFLAYNCGAGRVNELNKDIDLIKYEVYYKKNMEPYSDKIFNNYKKIIKGVN